VKLDLQEDDAKKLLAAGAHIGGKNCDSNMEKYVWKRRVDGIHVLHIGKTWEKIVLAARIIVAIENPQDVVIVAQRPFGQRAVFKAAQAIGCSYIAGRYTPGTFTNQIQRNFMEPRLLLVTDPRTDHQAVKEASYVNVPCIALTATDSPLEHVDVAIPCNNKTAASIATMWWLIAREVLRMRGQISRHEPWGTMADLFLYRTEEDVEKATAPAAAEAPAEAAPEAVAEPKAAEWTEDQQFAAQTGGAPAQQNWQPRQVSQSWDQQ